MGADIWFEGKYYLAHDKLPSNLKTKAYFTRHQLELPSHLVTKQYVETFGWENLYSLPNTAFNLSQIKEMEDILGRSLHGLTYSCPWDQLPQDLKTKNAMKRYRFKDLPLPVGQNILGNKIYELYSLKEAKQIAMAKYTTVMNQTPYCTCLKDVPPHLVTESWLASRGFYPTQPPITYYLRNKKEVIPLYEKSHHIAFCEETDIEFKGYYFNAFKQEPFFSKDQFYFQRRQLPLPSTPYGKRKVQRQLINLYQLPPIPLNPSQLAELSKELNQPLSGTVFMNHWEAIPHDFKTKTALKRADYPIPNQAVAINVHTQKIRPLYSLKEAKELKQSFSDEN